ncbi:hypothetical protein HPP92_011703 [Vanilla planifolia]|uniref:C3H1-type domain-containing protein n=1 Tax=Vanilla planifolia TaxID=51239 RepID=A0A835R3A6_VANPL|nr:hypothetical protein HPP92_011703 [Vanilla planifolia]
MSAFLRIQQFENTSRGSYISMCYCSTEQQSESTLVSMVAAGSSKEAQEEAAGLLLELSSADDLLAFKRLVEATDLPLDCSAPWYSRSLGPASSPVRRMGYERRSPLEIAALYGSTSVLSYILGRKSIDVNRRSGSDGTTTLHCASAGGSAASLQAVKLLIDASADVDAVDAMGNRPGDVIAKQFSASMARDLELLLKAPCPRVSAPSKERKEYPPDSTLPDIKSGIYGTDEFRMYTFKVKPCSRAYSHDWTECPFVHPGENARRRDPLKYSYSCVPCPEFRKGSCLKGDACEYAHGVFESWLHPAQYRTRLCKDEIGCNRRVCFFAHKPEELRSVNPTTASVSGLVLPSPRSSSQIGVSSLDMAAALMMLQSTPASPMSPSSCSALNSPTSWMNAVASMAQPPALQLPTSRLKSTLRARDLDLDLEGYQPNLIDEISNISSPRLNWKTNSLSSAAASRSSDYNDIYGSLDPAMLSQLQGLSLKQATGSATGLQMNQSMSQQLLSGFETNLPSSPRVNASSSFGHDHSLAKAIMNSRQAAFAKRSQSLIDRGALPRVAVPPPSPLPTSAAGTPSLGLYDWSSSDGKIDWAIQGDELNKLRKSATFNLKCNGSSSLGALSSASLEEPDLSWVQHLVKDGPSATGSGLAPIGRPGIEQQQKPYLRNGGADFLSWEQLKAEHEQLVA